MDYAQNIRSQPEPGLDRNRVVICDHNYMRSTMAAYGAFRKEGIALEIDYC
jgi:thymidylate kinase